MSNSRWSRWVDHSEKKKGFSSFLKEANQPGGNPTGTGIETPAQKAKRMGLMPDGHGAYSDPQTGQIVARTVNGELVFYDQGPTGGATSDGEGGGDAPVTGGGTAPTYRDPDTGAVVVPPAQPKNKAEKDAVPDPVPATAPAGYQDAMDKKKAKGQRKNELVARMSAAFDKNVAPYQEDPLASVKGRRDAVDAGIAAGEDPATAHEKIHGHEPASIDSNAALAATMGRVNDQGGLASITPDKDGTSLFAQDAAKGAESEAESGAESQPEPEAAPEPAEAPVAEEATVDEPDGLDDLLKEIRSPKTASEAKQTVGHPAGPSVQKPTNTEVSEGTTNFLDGIQNLASEGRQVAAKRNIQDRLNHEVAGPRIQEYMDTYAAEQKRLKETWDEVSTITDEESAMRYLTEGLGYVVGKNGRLSSPKEANRARRAMGGAGMPGEGRGESRAINYEEIQALSNPEWAEVINNAEDDGGKYLQSQTIKNDISWDLATKMYDKLDAKLQSKLNGWGKPEAAQGTFTPVGPVEFLKDADGNFTGETNIDALARTDYNEYAKHFSKDNAGNRGRGIFLLQKLMANGGRGQYSGLPTFYDLDTITPDHVIGRSSGDIGGGRFKDDPLNLVLDRRGLNQFKVSSQFDGPNGKERDTMKSMVNAAQKVSGAFGKVDGTQEHKGDLQSDPQFQNWAGYRIDQSDFDPKKIAQRSGKGGSASYPDSMQSVIDLDDAGVKQFVGKNEKKNPLGLNMRNFSMISPRAEKRPLVTNTWGGAAGGGVEYNPLTGYRRALLTNALFNPDTVDKLKAIEEDLNTNKKYAKWDDEKKADYLNKARRDMVDVNIFGPQKAMATLYGLGYLTTDEFVDRMSEFATSKLDFMKDSNPDEYQNLTAGLADTLEEYRAKLHKTMPDGPYQFPADELSENLSQPYIRAVMSSNYGRSKMPRELVEAFDNIKDNAKFTQNMYEEREMRFDDFMSEGKKTEEEEGD